MTSRLSSAALLAIVAAGILILALRMYPMVLATSPPTSLADRPPVLSMDADRAHDPSTILVQLRPGHTRADLPNNAVTVFGAWYELPVAPGAAAGMVQSWQSHPAVAAAELNLTVQLEQPFGTVASTSTANDPLYVFQWHISAIKAPQAWNRSTGSGVVVAVVDSGLSIGPDLACRSIIAPYNALNRQRTIEAVADANGHGTHVAGTVAQCTNNNLGVAGVAYDAALMPIKVCNDEGSCTMADLARGIDWARQQGADVINMSLGTDCAGVGSGTWPDCSSLVVNQAIDLAALDDIVLVAAAGNANQSVVGFPANHPAVIAVGAIDAAEDRAPYSSYGDQLSVVAPGGNMARDVNQDGVSDGVLQETVGSACGSTEVFDYCLFQGTSMAAPHVAGAVALLRAAAPEADRLAIQQALEQTAHDLGAAGFDAYYGHGAIQVDAALTALGVPANPTPPPPTSTVVAPSPTASISPTPSPTIAPVNKQLSPQLYLPFLVSEE